MTGECIMYKWSINHVRGKVIWKMVALKLSIFIEILTSASCSAVRQSLPCKPIWAPLAVQNFGKTTTPDSADFQYLPQTLQRGSAGSCFPIPCTHLLLGFETYGFICTQFATRIMGKICWRSQYSSEMVQWRKYVLWLILLHFLSFLIYFSSCFVKIHP